MAQIDAELLITLVENRPVIWDKTLEDYKDKTLRAAAWREICTILKDDFVELEEKERQNYAKAVVKKWNQLRDSWTRSLHVIKSAKKSGSGSVRAKSYCYHKHMLFLKKIINPAETHESANSTEIDKNNSDTEDGNLENAMNQNKEDELSAFEKPDQETPSNAKRSKKRDVSRQKLSAMDLKMMSFIDNQMSSKDNSQNDDRNMSFFKGLLPTLCSFNDDQVLEFQGGVINLLQNIKRRNNNVWSNQQPSTSNNDSYQSPPQGYFTSQYPVSVSSNSSHIDTFQPSPAESTCSDLTDFALI